MAGSGENEGGGGGGGGGAAAANLEVGRAERAVWLLKVPTVVGQSWQQQQDASNTLARVSLSLDPLNSDPQSAVQFSMTLVEKEATTAPKAFTLNFTKDLVPMHIFSETPQGRVAVEGKVEHKFDMKPTNMGNNDEAYRKLCRDRLNKSMLKTRTTQVLQNDRGGYMRPMPMEVWPVSASKDSKKKIAPGAIKAPEGKRIRKERGELEDIVFKLFERRPNWALKQLVEETDQPVAFLKEILNDLCMYNKRGANQGTYELKPEYRKNATEDVKPAV
ncbi:unnamed protein product [Sphagnum troendelagicum]|uniref:Transcription initiation factor IIF subunit beta n=1 Tax=Sphagnum troendelagicum TaxID=128251 RepID=A0ABP0UMW1_9BRYO